MARSRVTGVRETSNALGDLGRYIIVPTNQASRYALQPTLRQAKANAPRDKGVLKKSLVVRQDPNAPRAKPRHVVGPSKSVKERGRRPAWTAHLVEFGTAPHAQRGWFGRLIWHPGIRGTRFLTRAFEATKDQVAKRFGEKIGPAIEARAAKIAKKVRR